MRRRAALIALSAAPIAWWSAEAASAETAAPDDHGGWTVERAAVAPDLTAAFRRLAQHAGPDDWTGGDSTYSVELPGKRVWLFSDTFLGPVFADGGRPKDAAFLNNSFVVQRGDTLRTVTGGDPGHPDSLVVPAPDGAWWWFGAGTWNAPARSLDVCAIQFAFTGSGPLDFAWQRTALARFDDRQLRLQSMTPLPSSTAVTWSSWTLRQEGCTYIYGVEDLGLVKYMHLARTSGWDLTHAWEYWTGAGWSAHEDDSSRIMDGVANEYSVSRLGGRFLLVTQDTTELFSARILGYVGDTPYGPFTDPVLLYTTPETGRDGAYHNPNVYTYNAHEHPALRRGRTLHISYNVNSLDSDDLYADASIYHPRFVDVTVARAR